MLLPTRSARLASSGWQSRYWRRIKLPSRAVDNMLPFLPSRVTLTIGHWWQVAEFIHFPFQFKCSTGSSRNSVVVYVAPRDRAVAIHFRYHTNTIHLVSDARLFAVDTPQYTRGPRRSPQSYLGPLFNPHDHGHSFKQCHRSFINAVYLLNPLLG